MWERIAGTGVVMGLLSLLLYDLYPRGGLVGGLEVADPAAQLPTARTMVFTAMVIMQLFNALNSRSDLASAFAHRYTYKWLWLAITFGTLAQVAVVELPFLESAFGTAPLDAIRWVAAFGSGVVLLGYEEVVKAVRRGLAPR